MTTTALPVDERVERLRSLVSERRAAGVIAREQLERRFAETGTNYAMLEMAWGTLGHAAELRSMQLFASEVMPHFATT